MRNGGSDFGAQPLLSTNAQSIVQAQIQLYFEAGLR
jgi:hypothetical protein